MGRISAPKGINARAANLKCCKPKGIPMMVRQLPTPMAMELMQSPSPPSNIQMTFKRTEPEDMFPKYTFLPKGIRISFANLKHCKPTGIPTTVIQHNTPANIQHNPGCAHARNKARKKYRR